MIQCVKYLGAASAGEPSHKLVRAVVDGVVSDDPHGKEAMQRSNCSMPPSKPLPPETTP